MRETGHFCNDAQIKSLTFHVSGDLRIPCHHSFLHSFLVRLFDVRRQVVQKRENLIKASVDENIDAAIAKMDKALTPRK